MVSTMQCLLALFIYDISFYLVMALEQESKFILNLELGESYIYGTAFTSDNSYSINIQQASNNLVVLLQISQMWKSHAKH